MILFSYIFILCIWIHANVHNNSYPILFVYGKAISKVCHSRKTIKIQSIFLHWAQKLLFIVHSHIICSSLFNQNLFNRKLQFIKICLVSQWKVALAWFRSCCTFRFFSVKYKDKVQQIPWGAISGDINEFLRNVSYID